LWNLKGDRRKMKRRTIFGHVHVSTERRIPMRKERSFAVLLMFFVLFSAFVTTLPTVNSFTPESPMEKDESGSYDPRESITEDQNYAFSRYSSSGDGSFFHCANEQIAMRLTTKTEPESPSKGVVIGDDPEPSTPVRRFQQIREFDYHFSMCSSISGAVTWMKDEIPYYQQDMSQWCWAATLSMQHQWWAPIQLGNSYQQQSEIVQYIKGSVINQGATADEIHRMLQEWNNIDARYENFRLTYKGVGKLLSTDPPTGYTNDPKTWIHNVGSPVIALIDTDDPMDGIANHAVLVIGYDDSLDGGSVFIHDPWFSNWWPGHSGESCYELTLTYSEFNARWDSWYELPLNYHGMVVGIPGDSQVISVGYASLQFSGPINFNELEKIEVGVGPSGDNSAPSYDSFGEYYEDGVLVELSDPSSGETSYPINIGDFTSYSPTPPASYIYFATHAIPQGSARTGAYFHIKPNAVGKIWVNYKWWVNDEDDRTHTMKDTLEWVTVLDDRGGEDTSHSMLKPTLIKKTHGPYSDSFDVLPSEITITETLNPSTTPPHDNVQVHGTATFDDGSPVSYTDVTITITETGASWTTTTDASGYYSRYISAPGSGGTYTVRVDISSGELSGWNSKTLTVQSLPGGTYYTLYRTTTCKDVQPSSPYDPIDETEAFRTSDAIAYTWIHLTYIYRSLNVKWKWYDPNGNYQTECTATVPDPGAGSYWEWYKCWCGIYINGYSPQDIEGRWTSEVYIDEGSGYQLQAIEDFVIRYEVTGRTMAKDVQTYDPYEPIDPTYSFLNTDPKALAWIRLDEVAESLEIKWEWREPSGAIYGTFYWTTEDPGSAYWDWYKAWCYIDIYGHSPQSKLGQWEVRAYIKDVYGNWDVEYSQYFTISDNTPPGTPGTPTDAGEYSTSGTVTWTWTAAPEDGAVAQYQIQVGSTPGGNDVFDGLVGTELSKTLSGLLDGSTYYARVRAMNTVGQWGPWSGVSDGITVDTIPPDTTIDHSPSSSSVSLSASDATSGVAFTYYRIDSDSWNTYSGPFVLTGNESHVIEYYSRDNAGNNEPERTLVVHYLTVNTDPSGLDAPTGEGWYDYRTNASISVSSVPDYIFEYWYLDGQTGTPYSASMSATVTMDNPYVATAKFAWVPETKVYVDPAIVTENPGETFRINVTIANVVDLNAWEIKLRWDSSVLKCLPTIIEGPFLSNVGNTKMYVYESMIYKYIQIGVALSEPKTASGNGTLVTLDFLALPNYPGFTNLNLFDTYLYAIDLNEIPHTTADGEFTSTLVPIFTWTPEYPIANETVTFNATESFSGLGLNITDYSWDFGDGSTGTGAIVNHTYTAYRKEPYIVNLTLTDETARQVSLTKELLIYREVVIVDIWVSDQNLDEAFTTIDATAVSTYYPPYGILVSVVNYGTQTETFNVTLTFSAPTDLIGYGDFGPANTTYNITLDAGTGSGFSLWYDWNPTDPEGNPLPGGTYTFTATATPVEGEIETENNVYIYLIFVKILGDINGDEIVDIYDAIILANAFGSEPGDYNWNPDADLNNDSIIDIYDAIILAIHFGEEG
jgi:hypothetical protein